MNGWNSTVCEWLVQKVENLEFVNVYRELGAEVL